MLLLKEGIFHLEANSLLKEPPLMMREANISMSKLFPFEVYPVRSNTRLIKHSCQFLKMPMWEILCWDLTTGQPLWVIL